MPLAALLLAVILAPLSGLAQGAPNFPRDELTIETRAGERHAFTVELATTPDQQAYGLMFRESLAPDAGMLFLHRRDRVLTMWMRNTLVSLDMLFIAADGRITRIVERTVPLSTETISSGRPVRAVLEIKGGAARALGITAGDRVLHPAFGTAE